MCMFASLVKSGKIMPLSTCIRNHVVKYLAHKLKMLFSRSSISYKLGVCVSDYKQIVLCIQCKTLLRAVKHTQKEKKNT